MDPEKVIEASTGANVSSLGLPDATQFYRDALNGTYQQNIILSDIKKSRLKKLITEVNYTTHGEKTANVGHDILYANRELVRKVFKRSHNLTDTNISTLVIGSGMREVNQYTQENFDFHFCDIEGKDIVRIAISMLVKVSSIFKRKASKISVQERTEINAKLRSLQELIDAYKELEICPNNFYTSVPRKNYTALLLEDSAYNLDRNGWIELFGKTNASIAYGYMMMPIEFQFPDMVQSDLYTLYNGKGGEVAFCYADSTEFGYVHQRDNWRFIIDNCGIHTPFFNITFEYRRIGAMIIFTAVKTQKSCHLVRDIILSSNQRTYKIFDVMENYNEYTNTFTGNKYFVVSEDEFLIGKNYALALAEKSNTVENAMTFVRRRTDGVALVNKELLPGWSLDQDKMYSFTIALYLYVCFNRDRKDAILKHNFEYDPLTSFWQSLKTMFSIDFFKNFRKMSLWDKLVIKNPWKIHQSMVLPSAKRTIPQNFDFKLLLDKHSKNDDCRTCKFLEASVKDDDNKQKWVCKNLPDSMHTFELSTAELSKLSAELLDTSNDGGDLAKAKDNARKNIPESGFKFTTYVEFIQGPPGTGKSKTIRAMADLMDIIGAPFSKLSADYLGVEIKDPVTGLKRTVNYLFKTTHRLVRSYGSRTIFIDEFTALDYRYIALAAYLNQAQRVVIVGDKDQIGITEGPDCYSVLNHMDFSRLSSHHLLKNYRNPKDAIYLLNKYYGYNLIATKSIVRSIEFTTFGESLDIPGTSLYFTDNTKNEYLPGIDNCKSVTSFQGSADDSIKLYISRYDGPMIRNPKFLRVALSRHYTCLYIICLDDSQLCKNFQIKHDLTNEGDQTIIEGTADFDIQKEEELDPADIEFLNKYRKDDEHIVNAFGALYDDDSQNFVVSTIEKLRKILTEHKILISDLFKLLIYIAIFKKGTSLGLKLAYKLLRFWMLILFKITKFNFRFEFNLLDRLIESFIELYKTQRVLVLKFLQFMCTGVDPEQTYEHIQNCWIPNNADQLDVFEKQLLTQENSILEDYDGYCWTQIFNPWFALELESSNQFGPGITFLNIICLVLKHPDQINTYVQIVPGHATVSRGAMISKGNLFDVCSIVYQSLHSVAFLSQLINNFLQNCIQFVFGSKSFYVNLLLGLAHGYFSNRAMLINFIVNAINTESSVLKTFVGTLVNLSYEYSNIKPSIKFPVIVIISFLLMKYMKKNSELEKEIDRLNKILNSRIYIKGFIGSYAFYLIVAYLLYLVLKQASNLVVNRIVHFNSGYLSRFAPTSVKGYLEHIEQPEDQVFVGDKDVEMEGDYKNQVEQYFTPQVESAVVIFSKQKESPDQIYSFERPSSDAYLISDQIVPRSLNYDITYACNDFYDMQVVPNFSNGKVNASDIFKINLRQHPEKQTETFYQHHPGFGLRYSSKNKFQTLQVIQKRYANKDQKPMPFDHNAILLAEKMVDKFVTDCVDLSFWKKLDETVLYGIFQEFVKQARTKNYPNMYLGLDNHKAREVQFHLKTIYKVGKNANQKELDYKKAGQGISAWNKDTQILFSLVGKIFNEAFRLCLKSNIIYDNKMTQNQLIDKINYEFSRIPHIAKNMVTDFGAYDSSQNEFTQEIERKFWIKLGFSSIVVDHYYSFRKKYFIRSTLGCAKVKYVKPSGEPLTLPNNSVLNAVTSHYIGEGVGDFVIIVKGDDGGKRQTDLQLNLDRLNEILTYVSFDIKISFDNVLEFCGCILGDCGLLPDLIRKLEKILTHSFRDIEHFQEYQIGLRDFMSKLKELNVNEVIAANADMHHMSPLDIEAAIYAIDSFSHLNEQQFLSYFKRVDIEYGIPTKLNALTHITDYTIESVYDLKTHSDTRIKNMVKTHVRMNSNNFKQFFVAIQKPLTGTYKIPKELYEYCCKTVHTMPNNLQKIYVLKNLADTFHY